MPKPSLWKDMKKTFMLHAIAAHFSNGLIPVAVLYLLLTLPTGNTFFEHTAQHLLWITFLAIPVSFFPAFMTGARSIGLRRLRFS